MFGIAFDPDRPLIASSSFTAGDEQIAAGAVFDWRARGISQVDALVLFRSGLLVHPIETPGGRVETELPKNKRRDRR